MSKLLITICILYLMVPDLISASKPYAWNKPKARRSEAAVQSPKLDLPNNADRDIILNSLNDQFRPNALDEDTDEKPEGMKCLKYDQNLEKSAYERAQECNIERSQTPTTDPSNKYLKVLESWAVLQKYSYDDAIGDMYVEGALNDYKKDTGACNPQCYNYKTITHDDNEAVGCARVKCKTVKGSAEGGILHVCHFGSSSAYDYDKKPYLSHVDGCKPNTCPAHKNTCTKGLCCDSDTEEMSSSSVSYSVSPGLASSILSSTMSSSNESSLNDTSLEMNPITQSSVSAQSISMSSSAMTSARSSSAGLSTRSSGDEFTSASSSSIASNEFSSSISPQSSIASTEDSAKSSEFTSAILSTSSSMGMSESMNSTASSSIEFTSSTQISSTAAQSQQSSDTISAYTSPVADGSSSLAMSSQMSTQSSIAQSSVSSAVSAVSASGSSLDYSMSSGSVTSPSIEGCEDQLPECKDWKHMCKTEPGKYMVLCRRTCENCNGLNCVNSDKFKCDRHAKASVNWCQRFPDTMFRFCPLACDKCPLLYTTTQMSSSLSTAALPDDCKDEPNMECTQELCERVPGYYLPKCKRTCRNCGDTKTCADSTTFNCEYYGQDSVGYCQKFNEDMALFCPLKCKSCKNIYASDPLTPARRRTFKFPLTIDECVDSDQTLCAQAKCDAEPGIYLQKCKRKCNNCDGTQCKDSNKFKCNLYRKSHCQQFAGLADKCPLLCGRCTPGQKW